MQQSLKDFSQQKLTVNSWVPKILCVAAISYTIALTIGSLIKPVKLKLSTFAYSDKVLHLVAYIGLSILWLSFYHLVKQYFWAQWKPKKYYVIIAIILVIYGIIIELLQGSITDYRTPDVWDVLANSIGVVVGSAVFVLFFKNFKRLKFRN